MIVANDNPGATSEWVRNVIGLCRAVIDMRPDLSGIPAIIRPSDPGDVAFASYEPVGPVPGWLERFTSRTEP